MPDLISKRLDVAKSDLEKAGYGDEPEVLGGGAFGVVIDSNWTVCEQDPAPGEPVDGTPQLTVDRSCPDADKADDEEAPEEPSSEPEPAKTDEAMWAANYDENQVAYAADLAVVLGVKNVRSLVAEVPLASCGLLKKDRPIGERTSKAAKALDLRRPPTAAQIFDAISVATMYVCPELADRHTTQVTKYEKAERQAAEKAMRKKRKEEARQRREEEQQEAQNTPPPPVSVYYANCTEVENAGAAPIYAGDPGYSTDLDRDGDGVACEQ